MPAANFHFPTSANCGKCNSCGCRVKSSRVSRYWCCRRLDRFQAAWFCPACSVLCNTGDRQPWNIRGSCTTSEQHTQAPLFVSLLFRTGATSCWLDLFHHSTFFGLQQSGERLQMVGSRAVYGLRITPYLRVKYGCRPCATASQQPPA